MKVSIIVRTYNEAKWLPHALRAIGRQNKSGTCVETIVVDSGSTDETLQIAKNFCCRIIRIKKEEFTFGRALNIGCSAADGEVLVFLSAHCIPIGTDWLKRLIDPLGKDGIVYTYGRQEAHPESKYSEAQLFKKYFPDRNRLPQDGFFCNNANAALLRDVWRAHLFNEDLTGLEDMELAKRLVAGGAKIGYVADASVVHIHQESWRKIRTRYEREAIALRAIMPEIHISFMDFLRYFVSGVLFDWSQAIQDRVFFEKAGEILLFRLMQYWGTYRGNNEHRKMSRARKEEYFYPR